MIYRRFLSIQKRFLLLQLPRRIATPAAIATASITASGGALVVVGHGVLVRFLLCSP